MNAELLNAKKVLSRSNTRGQCERVLLCRLGSVSFTLNQIELLTTYGSVAKKHCLH